MTDQRRETCKWWHQPNPGRVGVCDAFKYGALITHGEHHCDLWEPIVYEWTEMKVVFTDQSDREPQ